MNVGEIRSRVYRLFGDEANVQISDDDVTNWINDGMRYAVTINETLLQTKSSLVNIVADTDIYSLPADCFMLQNVKIKRYSTDNSYYDLDYLSSQEINQFSADWDGTDRPASIPMAFIRYSATQIRLFPRPSESISSGLFYYYTKYPTDITTTAADTPELPLHYHEALLNYCLYKAYIKDDDPTNAQLMLNMVDNQIKLNSEKENWDSVEYYKTITVRPEDL